MEPEICLVHSEQGVRENHHYPRGQKQHDPHVLRVLSPPALTTAPVRGGCVVTGVSCGIMHATRIRHCSSGGTDLLDETASRWATTCRILAKHTLGGQGADADSSTGVRSVILRSQHRLETWTCPRSCLPSWGHLHKAGQMVAAALRQGGKNGTELVLSAAAQSPLALQRSCRKSRDESG